MVELSIEEGKLVPSVIGADWGHEFSAEDKDVLTHIYDRDFEQVLGLLKQAEFNWI